MALERGGEGRGAGRPADGTNPGWMPANPGNGAHQSQGPRGLRMVGRAGPAGPLSRTGRARRCGPRTPVWQDPRERAHRDGLCARQGSSGSVPVRPQAARTQASPQHLFSPRPFPALGLAGETATHTDARAPGSGRALSLTPTATPGFLTREARPPAGARRVMVMLGAHKTTALGAAGESQEGPARAGDEASSGPHLLSTREAGADGSGGCGCRGGAGWTSPCGKQVSRPRRNTGGGGDPFLSPSAWAAKYKFSP